MTHKKYVREETARYDKQQTTLVCSVVPDVIKYDTSKAPNLSIEKNVRPYAIQFNQIDPEKIMICPFCLGQHKLMKFYIQKKNGIDKRLGKCPECQKQMLLRTLIGMLKWDAKQFAKWVYDYRLSGFWNKVNFEVWKTRLFDLNMSYDFWDEYKKLKGTSEFAYGDTGTPYVTASENEAWKEYGKGD